MKRQSRRHSAPRELDICQLIESFGAESKCHAYLQTLRWPEGVKCPRCHSEKISRITTRDQFDCDQCRYQFSVRVNTILHDSHLPLWKWFLAVYQMIQSRKGVSANQLKRTLGLSYKTAWYLCHRIRKAMAEMNAVKLGGTVEVDETWIGGKQRYVGSGNKDNKTMVLGAIERGGRVRLRVEKRPTKKLLRKFIDENVGGWAKSIYTDQAPAYGDLADFDTKHETVDHSKEEWVRGDVHTNSIEGFWAQVKNSVRGVHHGVAPEYLQHYVNEYAFRYNHRNDTTPMFQTILERIVTAD